MVIFVLHTCILLSFQLKCALFFVSACQDCEMLEAETKHFEDLEFQQLEKESRLDEEKETRTQQLLRDIADYQRSMVTRKVRAISLLIKLGQKSVYITVSVLHLNF